MARSITAAYRPPPTACSLQHATVAGCFLLKEKSPSRIRLPLHSSSPVVANYCCAALSASWAHTMDQLPLPSNQFPATRFQPLDPNSPSTYSLPLFESLRLQSNLTDAAGNNCTRGMHFVGWCCCCCCHSLDCFVKQLTCRCVGKRVTRATSFRLYLSNGARCRHKSRPFATSARRASNFLPQINHAAVPFAFGLHFSAISCHITHAARVAVVWVGGLTAPTAWIIEWERQKRSILFGLLLLLLLLSVGIQLNALGQCVHCPCPLRAGSILLSTCS